MRTRYCTIALFTTAFAVLSCSETFVDAVIEGSDDGDAGVDTDIDTDFLEVQPGIACGAGRTCILTAEGQVKCWGSWSASGYDNEGESIGDEDGEYPSSVGYLDLGGEVAQISTGDYHTCALRRSGSLKCWGFGSDGRLGYGNEVDVLDASASEDVDLGGRAVQVSAGGKHTCVVMEKGTVRCFGDGSAGQLGYENTDNLGNVSGDMPPADVDLGGTVVSVHAGYDHTCALMEAGTVRCFGNGQLGRLGYGNEDNVGALAGDMPPPDVSLGETVAQLATGYSHTCVVVETGGVRCFGYGGGGILGTGDISNIGDNQDEMPPADVDVGASVIEVATGSAHTCVRLQGGDIRCFGTGAAGRLGLGHEDNIGDDEAPSMAPIVPIGGEVDLLAAGDWHSCAILNDSTVRVRCFGHGQSGGLGYGGEFNVGDGIAPGANISDVGDVSL